ncbi:MAG TPA: hypothetical protein VE981_23980 [Planctomycetota bacterium]|nr:hypothetical protein [Planctomycetota bacterium]
MKTLMAILLLSTPVLAQDKPKEGEHPRQDRPRDGDPPRPPGTPRDGDPRPPGPPRDGDPRPPGAPRDGDRPGTPRENARRAVPPFNPDEVRAWIKDNEPETFRRLSQFQEEGKREDVQRVLADASMRMREMADLKQRDPKAYERMQEMRRLEREGMELAEQARRSPPEEKDGVSKKLAENLTKQFDLREEQRVREIAELKRRVEALEKALGDRKGNKEKIVERRRRELMGEKVDEDW